MKKNANRLILSRNDLMKILPLAILLMLIIPLVQSCGEDEPGTSYDLEGIVQKGPFVQGTSITIYELNEDMEQTGRSYETTTDDAGKFSLSGVEFVSPYVRLKANGFYYNENSGRISNAQLTLYCIADVSQAASLNINILSHLEYERIMYLVQEGTNFENAKEQAMGELLAVLGVDESGISNPELLDISAAGNGNALLLAASIVFQGNYSAGDFTEFINSIANDLKEDGLVDDVDLGLELIRNANLANTSKVRTNLEERYTELGETYSIPDFEGYVSNFLENSPFISGYCMGCETGTVEDIDGNVYETVKIGSQWWMAENLKTNHFANGDEITYFTDSMSYYAATGPGFMAYHYDTTGYTGEYGNLYNWYAVVDDRNLCPAGWHTPSKSEYQALANGLGGNELAGGKLKSTTDDWMWDNDGATNESGFSALPAGMSGTNSLGIDAYFWSTGEDDSELGYGWMLSTTNTEFNERIEMKASGMSVRCVKD